MLNMNELLARYQLELDGYFPNGGPHHFDDRDACGNTPLIFAAYRGSVHEAETLLSAGADINARGDNELTALHVAARNGDAAMIQVLMRYKPNMASLDHRGRTPVDVADSILDADIREKILRALRGIDLFSPNALD